MTLILSFTAPDAIRVDLTGGKGASLSKLFRAGFPVPPGFTVTATAYRAFVEEHRTTLARAEQFSWQNPALLETQANALVEELRLLPVPAAVERELQVALGAFDSAQRFSVRSSATAEDSASAAFAGQHDTYLNCHGAEEVMRRLRDCWLSLFAPRALAYRHHAGFTIAGADMAVVVQCMVMADKAGVAFSVDPVLGRLDHVSIDANYGLGESVVGGEAEVDHYVASRDGTAVVSQAIAEKTEKIIATADQGTMHVVLSGDEAIAPVLSPQEVSDISTLAVRAETFYGFPQDTEWAIASGHLYLLQSRPITSIAPRWTRDESAERFPNPISPLAWDLVEAGFHQSLNHSFALMGLPPFQGKWFAMHDSFIYGNQNAVALYGNFSPVAIRSLEDLRGALPVLRDRFAWVQELPLRWSRDLDHYLIRIGELMSTDLSDMTLRENWRYVLDVRDLGADYFLPNIAISLTQRTLYRLLHGLLTLLAGPEQASVLFDRLLAWTETKTGVINRELYDMAVEIRGTPALTAAFRDQQATRILTDVLPQWPGLAQRFRRFLRDHGHREIEFDPYVATWLDAPEVVIDTLRLMVAQPVSVTPQQKELELRHVAEQTLYSLGARVPEDLRFLFSEIVRLARAYTSLDDLEHYQTTRLTLPFRKGLRALGEHLVKLGVVDEPMDVFFASYNSLNDAINEPDAARWPALREEVLRAKEVYRDARRRTPAWSLDEDEPSVEDAENTNVMTGLAGSPGSAEGTVYLVHGPEDFAGFPSGAVLVARTTNPAWTPLFYGASAVVTESGGPLSHGAVTAREMGKPAVMGVRGVMARLNNGDRIRIEGSAGRITLL